ncbi:MAG TPA: CarD family transcriptional regulator [Anaerolineae bacterium]|nr:CarD family transcriptional regulator [Anaerolineae bacterium]
MFKVGDKIVHPAHGAGVVTGIETVNLLDEFSRYYIIDPIASDIRLMVPVRMAQELGLRQAVRLREAFRALDLLGKPPTPLPEDYKERQAQIEERLKDGDFVAVTEVVRDLYWLEREGSLTAKDTSLLDRARQLLVGELAVAAGIELEEAERELQAALERRDQILER